MIQNIIEIKQKMLKIINIFTIQMIIKTLEVHIISIIIEIQMMLRTIKVI